MLSWLLRPPLRRMTASSPRLAQPRRPEVWHNPWQELPASGTPEPQNPKLGTCFQDREPRLWSCSHSVAHSVVVCRCDASGPEVFQLRHFVASEHGAMEYPSTLPVVCFQTLLDAPLARKIGLAFLLVVSFSVLVIKRNSGQHKP